MNKKGELETFVIIVFGIIFLFAAIYGLVYAFTNGSEKITIEEKWVKHKGHDAKYLVSTTDGQVFEITDSWIKGRWDSSNLYAKLKEGQTCKIDTQGFRAPFFSDYKNIITASCDVDGIRNGEQETITIS